MTLHYSFDIGCRPDGGVAAAAAAANGPRVGPFETQWGSILTLDNRQDASLAQYRRPNPLTCRAVGPSRSFWCDLLCFQDVGWRSGSLGLKRFQFPEIMTSLIQIIQAVSRWNSILCVSQQLHTDETNFPAQQRRTFTRRKPLVHELMTC